jgi:hypothetical protein
MDQPQRCPDTTLPAAAAERGPVDFPELLLTPGVGARPVQSLARVAEVVHGTPEGLTCTAHCRAETLPDFRHPSKA